MLVGYSPDNIPWLASGLSAGQSLPNTFPCLSRGMIHPNPGACRCLANSLRSLLAPSQTVSAPSFFQHAPFILIIFTTSAAITASGVAVPFESSPRSQQGLQLSSLYTRARSSMQPFPRSIKKDSYPSWQGRLPSPLQAVPSILLGSFADSKE